MARSPAARRARRSGGASPDEWLEVPGWRRPLDTLLVLAVTFATAWVGLVVIPAAARSDSSVTHPVTPTKNDAAPPTAGPTQDPGQWFAGPVYTGGPAAPTTAQVAAEAPVVVAAAAPRAPDHRATPRTATPHAAPRTTANPAAPTTTVAAAAAAATTALATTAATTTPTAATPAVTTPPAETTTTSDTTPSSSTTTDASTTEPTATETTTTTPATSTSAAAL